MRKVPLLFLLVINFCSTAFTQHKVHLKVGYLPGHSYIEKADQITNIEMELKGSAITANDEGPIKKGIVQHTEKETSVGSYYNDSLFPIKTLLTKMTMAEGKAPIAPGTILYSTGTKSGKRTLDSISADGMDSELKEKLFPLLQTVIKAANIPEHNFKVGESFSFETPINLPVAGMILNFVMKTTYTLKSATGSIAYFDIALVYTIQSESVSIPVTATGNGSGSMTYDINNNYYTSFEINENLSMNMSMEDRSMKMKMESTSIQKAAVSKN